MIARVYSWLRGHPGGAYSPYDMPNIKPVADKANVLFTPALVSCSFALSCA